MLDNQRFVGSECSREVAQSSQAREPRAVIGRVVGSPVRIDGVQVRVGHERLQQRVTAIDARVQQADAWRGVPLGGCMETRQRVLAPLLLLDRCQAIEEFGGLLRAAQLGDAVERHDRRRKLLLRAAHHDDSAFGKIDLAAAHLAARERGELAEVGNDGVPVATNRQPHFPPEHLGGILGQEAGLVSPQRAHFGAPNRRDGVNQGAMIERITVDLLAFGQIVADVLLEVGELPLRHEDVGDRPVALGPDAQDLDLLLRVAPDFVSQAFEGEFHVGDADELHLKTQAAFEPLLALRCDGFVRDGPESLKLGPQRCPVFGAIERWRLRTTAAARRRGEGLRLRRVCQDKMGASISSLFRHGWTSACFAVPALP